MKAILLFIAVAYASQETLMAESKLNVIKEKPEGRASMFGIELLTRTKDSSLLSSRFILDFNSSKVLIGDSNKLDWGLNCSDLEFCQITKQDVLKDNYNGISYEYQEGSIQLFVSKDNVFSEDDPEESDFRYVEKADKAFDNNWGVLGLSPTSDFFNYLNRLYKDFNVSVFMRQKEDEWELDLYMNHDQNEVKGEHTILEKDVWAVSAMYGAFPVAITLCFDIVGDHLLNFRGAKNVCKNNMIKICDGEESCKYSKADLDKAETLKININSILYEFAPKEYLKEGDDGNVECVLVDEPRPEVCDYSAGRYFSERYPPILSIGETNKITLLERFRYKQNVPLIVATIIGTIIMMVIVTGLFELIILKLKKKDSSKDEGLTERLNVDQDDTGRLNDEA